MIQYKIHAIKYATVNSSRIGAIISGVKVQYVSEARRNDWSFAGFDNKAFCKPLFRTLSGALWDLI